MGFGFLGSGLRVLGSECKVKGLTNSRGGQPWWPSRYPGLTVERMPHKYWSRPDPGLNIQVKNRTAIQAVPSSLGSEVEEVVPGEIAGHTARTVVLLLGWRAWVLQEGQGCRVQGRWSDPPWRQPRGKS